MNYIFPCHDDIVKIERNGLKFKITFKKNIKILKFHKYIDQVRSDGIYLYFKSVINQGFSIHRYEPKLQKIHTFNFENNQDVAFYNGLVFSANSMNDKLVIICRDDKIEQEYNFKENGNYKYILSSVNSNFMIIVYTTHLIVIDMINFKGDWMKCNLEPDFIPIEVSGDKVVLTSSKDYFSVIHLNDKCYTNHEILNKNVIPIQDLTGIHLITYSKKECIIYSINSKNPKTRNNKIIINGKNVFDLKTFKFNKPESSLNQIPYFERNCCTHIDSSFYTPIELEEINKVCRQSDPVLHRKYIPGITVPPPGIKYRINSSKEIPVQVRLHHGQRKLFMGELDLFTQLLESANSRANVLYAGAAPGYHIKLLSQLFPNIKFFLYDPAKFVDFTNMKNIIVNNGFFTDDTAKEWSNGKCDIFISDIRLDPQGDAEDFEKQVEMDMDMQKRWTRIIKPNLGSMLKFRPKFEGDQSYFDKYLNGNVMIQCWSPVSSTETRLIVTKDLEKLVSYDGQEYQDWMFYHNYILRSWATYTPPVEGLENVKGYDRCFDCTNEALIWTQYLAMKEVPYKFKNLKVADLMNKLTEITKQRLLVPKKSHHGMYPNLGLCNRYPLFFKK